MGKTLSQILVGFEYELVSCDTLTEVNVADVSDIEISSLAFDSRDVKQNSLFFALPGTHVNGNDFIVSAIKNGAAAIVFEGEFSSDVKKDCAKEIAHRHIQSALGQDEEGKSVCDKNTNFPVPAFIKVKNSRKVMAPISDAFYDSPSKKLVMIGVTGTEGKSSTVSFIWQLLRLFGKKTGFISTVEYSFGDEAIKNPEHQTTPESPIVQRYLAEMVQNGCEYAVVEASSHGLSAKLNRLGNIYFDAVVFMNVTLEHLEFHKTFECYRDDKANLFRALDIHNHKKTINGKDVKVPAIGVVNLDDESAPSFVRATKTECNGFCIKCDFARPDDLPNLKDVIHAVNIESNKNTLDFEIKNKFTSLKVNSNLPGAFNTYNIMASILVVSKLLEVSLDEIVKKIGKIKPIAGRMSIVDKGQDFEVIIDYAHTPSSFETIFPPIRKRCEGKMICVFGSGGERDITKRPIQGEIAAKYCDVVILADEDPRGEDPVELLKQIAVGSQKVGKVMEKNLFIIHDRPQAIRYAFKIAKKGDIVLLLGKSHENSIIYKDKVMPYDEKTEAEKALGEML